MPPFSPERMELSRRRKDAHDALSDACDAGLLTDDELLMVRIEYALAGGDPAILERGVALAEARAAVRSPFGFTTTDDSQRLTTTNRAGGGKPQVRGPQQPVGAGQGRGPGHSGDFHEKPPTESVDAGQG